MVHKRPPAAGATHLPPWFRERFGRGKYQSTDRGRTRRSRAADLGDSRIARRRRHRAVRGALSQGNHRRSRRRAIAHAGRAADLSARARGAPGRHSQFGPRAGQARRRAGSRNHGGRQQGASGRHLSAVQAEAPHQGRDRQGSRARTIVRTVADAAAERSAGRGRELRRRREAGGGRRRGARRRTRDPGGALCRGCRSDRALARRNVVERGDDIHRAQGQEDRRREVQGLFRLQRSPPQATVAPHSRAVSGREGRNPRAADIARCAGPGRQCTERV